MPTRLPVFTAPIWLIWLASFASKAVNWPLIKASYGIKPQYDTSKVVADLGLEFLPLKQTAVDMAASMVEYGILPRLPGAPAGGVAAKL